MMSLTPYVKRIIKLSKHFPIFPCLPKTRKSGDREFKAKSPLVKEWKASATQDEATIIDWWEKWPDALVGAPCGAKSNMFVVDLDELTVAGKKISGVDIVPHLKGEMPTTLGQKTRRGYHLIYNYVEGLKNSGSKILKGVDTRSEGGYIIMAPSAGYSIEGKIADKCDPPKWIQDAFKYEEKDSTSQFNAKSADEVKYCLNGLDPDKYGSYAEWTRIMSACYHSSCGDLEVKEAFKVWSSFAESAFDEMTEDKIDYQWERMATDREDKCTFGTLVHEYKEKHGDYFYGEAFDDIEPLDTKIRVKPETKDKHMQKAGKHGDGSIKPNTFNFNIMMQNEQIGGKTNDMGGLFKFNELAQCPYLIGTAPWGKREGIVDRMLRDSDLTGASIHIAGKFKVDFPKNIITEGISFASEMLKYHPVRDYLDRVEWDGKDRLSCWLYELTNTEPTEMNSVFMSKWLISAVARVYEPGCKADCMLIFEGNQGMGKSEILGKQGLGGAFYRSPVIKNLTSKEDLISCMGAWIIDFDELNVFNTASIQAIKKFISQRDDSVRFNYNKFTSDIPRQFILCASMNVLGEGTYLEDPSGARRFWPILTDGVGENTGKKISITQIWKWMKDNRDQLWAQAAHCYRKGDIYHLTDDEEAKARELQDGRTFKDPVVDDIENFLNRTPEGKKWIAPSSAEVLELVMGISSVEATQKDLKRVAVALKSLGWLRKKTRVDSAGNSSDRARWAFFRPGYDDKGDIEIE